MRRFFDAFWDRAPVAAAFRSGNGKDVAQNGTAGRAGVRAGPAVEADPAQALRLFVFVFFVWVLLRNTWICEDAFITYRVSDNWIHGFGLRWNPLDRVQVYTHPLWLLCISAVHF